MAGYYYDLEQPEANLMKAANALALQCESLILRLENNDKTDKRAVELAKTNLQQGFMWARRSITDQAGL